MNYNVLVTGIGGNVGQGILRNIQSYDPAIRLIGTNTVFLSAGNHLCHDVYQVPTADQADYIKKIQAICAKEHINLIIPATDAETYYLSLHANNLPTIAASPAITSELFFDKYKTWEAFHTLGIPFAETVLPSDYHNQFDLTITKPSQGRGSRNIYVDHPDPASFPPEYIIQKRYLGQEITTSFYVTKANTCLGSITFERELQQGMTAICQTTTAYDKKLHAIIDRMIKAFEIRGSCNIQSIVDTATKKVIPFEINARISGTNSIRSHFGFQDVVYTIQEYLYQTTPATPKITHGSAIRYVTDIIYPDIDLSAIKNKATQYYIAV